MHEDQEIQPRRPRLEIGVPDSLDSLVERIDISVSGAKVDLALVNYR